MAALVAGCATGQEVHATGAASAATNATAAAPPGACANAQRALYSADQVRTIMKMREEGESLRSVTRVVGGTRDDVKRVETAERGNRRRARIRTAGDGSAGAPPSPAPCEPYARTPRAPLTAGTPPAARAGAPAGTNARLTPAAAPPPIVPAGTDPVPDPVPREGSRADTPAASDLAQDRIAGGRP
jgi:hypothetical protein